MNERNYLEKEGVEGRTIQKWIFRKCDGGSME
jgi:hypothetical protein